MKAERFATAAFSFILLLNLGVTQCPAAPANDMFANRLVVTGTNFSVSGSNVGATLEAGEPEHAGDSGGASAWWSWTAPRSEPTTITTSGSSFDTLLSVYTGTSISNLTTIAENDDDPEAGDLTSKVVFTAAANQTYQIAVDGYSGASGSIRLNISLTPPQPAAAWHLPAPNGTMIYSTSFAGKVVVLDFWATWCSPCKAELPDLVALQAQYGTDGLAVIGADVSWSSETAQTVLNFLAAWAPPINYQIVMSDLATETPFGGIDAIPTTFIIDRQNLVRNRYVGTQTRSTLEEQIVPLLYGNAVLACQSSGGQMRLSWPTNARAFTLESATSLLNPVWFTWPTPPTVVGGSNIVQVSPTNSLRLFRLRMPVVN